MSKNPGPDDFTPQLYMEVPSWSPDLCPRQGSWELKAAYSQLPASAGYSLDLAVKSVQP